MTKRLGEQQSSLGGGMSREDRKNEAISRMIERQEQLRKKREEKKKLAVLNQKTGASGVKPPNSSSSGQRKQMLKQQAIIEQKPERSSVQIHLVFSDSIRSSNASSRYFYERKQTVEERQRQEEQEMWTRLAQAQFMNQQPRQGQHMDQGQAQGMGYYINTGGDTGGNYEALDDYTGSSYLSSASKRQRADDWGPQTQTNQQMTAQQAMLIQQQQNMLLHSNVWDPAGSQMMQSNLAGMQQAALAQAYNYNQQCFEDQSPSQNVVIPQSVQLVNPISAEDSIKESSACNEPIKEEPIKIKVDIPKEKVESSPLVPSTAISFGRTASSKDGPDNEAQSILEMTKNLQSRLQSKQRRAAPPADTTPELNINAGQEKPAQS